MKQNQNLVQLNDEDTVNEVVLLTDKATLTTRRLRDSGEMIAECTIARTGIMLYKAKELGEIAKHLDPESICRVRTKPEVLFDEATIEGCRSIPVTIGHPKDDVNIKNNKELQKGFIEGRPMADGSFLAASIVLNDEQAIRLVDSGVDQISLGHNAELAVAEDADADFDKVRIIPNHAAIVVRGRAQTTRIGDSGEEISIVDKATFDVVEAERDAALDKISTLEQKLADAETARLSDEAIQAEVDKRVVARTALLIDVARLGDEFSSLDFSGKSDSEVKLAVVNKLHDKDFSDKSEDYISARFDAALEDCDSITLGDALNQSMQFTAQKDSEARKPKVSISEEANKRRLERFNSL